MSTSTSLPLPTLKDRVAVVTGSGRGIGKGIVLELARRGAHVVVNYAHSAEAAQAVVAEVERLGAGSRAIAVQGDVTQQADIDRLFAETVARFGRVDVVVSNSGIESFERAEDVTPERWDRVFAVNARAQFFVAVAAFRTMQAQPSPYARRIVLMSSIAARVMGVRDHALYAASKSAVEGVVRSLATDFGPHGITVNAVAPGGVKTDMFAEAAINYIPGADRTWPAERVEAAVAESCPMKRVALPRDIGNVVAWLAGDDSEWITGQVILASGGSSV